MNNTIYDTIIVGGGIAGLTAAAYLSRAGQNTLLIERNNEFGGLVSTFKRDGFSFEAGVRALESAGIILPMLQDLGIELETVRSKVSVGVENEILNTEDLSSVDEYQNMLIRLYPESKNDIQHFIKIMKKIMKYVDVLYGIENPVFKDLIRDKKYILTKLTPWLPKFLFTVGKINSLRMPIEPYLKKIIKNQSLVDIISQHFFKGTPTFFALSYFSLYLDYFYPKGGVGQIAEALVKKTKEQNGQLKPKTTIIEVDAKNQWVIDENKHQYAYKNLIWAGDLKTFYKITQTNNLKPSLIENFEKTKNSFLEVKGAESVYSLYLEINLPLEYFRKISHGHFFYTPSKKGLGETHWSELAQLLKNWNPSNKEEVYQWLNKFLALNTFEISIPGLKDATMVPENKTGIIISFLSDYQLFKNVSKDDWYDEFIDYINAKVIQILTNAIYPELKDNIIKSFSFSPLSIENRTKSSEGAIVGWSFEDKVPVLNNILKTAQAVETPIPNIFQAGQWAYSPAGVPMSILIKFKMSFSSVTPPFTKTSSSITNAGVAITL